MYAWYDLDTPTSLPPGSMRGTVLEDGMLCWTLRFVSLSTLLYRICYGFRNGGSYGVFMKKARHFQRSGPCTRYLQGQCDHPCRRGRCRHLEYLALKIGLAFFAFMSCRNCSVTYPDESFIVLYLAGRCCCKLSVAAAALSLSQNLLMSVRLYEVLRGSGNYENVRLSGPLLMLTGVHTS